MNFPIALFALAAARQANDSPADAGRIALVSMLVKPPILGLLLAVTMAKQATPAPAVLSTNTGSTITSKGALVLNQVAPQTDLHSFFPSFVQFTENQALEFAKELRLNAKVVDRSSGHSKIVGQQDPAPGAGWPHDRIVTLYLG